MREFSSALIFLGLLIAGFGLFYLVIYEGVYEPTLPGHRRSNQDNLEMLIGVVLVYIGLVGTVLGLLAIKIQKFISTADKLTSKSKEDSAPIVEEQDIAFNCPFCGQGMKALGKCPKCGSTVDQAVLDSHSK